MKYGICYVSTATDQFKEDNLENFMSTIFQKNKELSFRGILIYSEGNFLQVLEGEKTALLQLYNKIEQDSRHKGIIQIVGRELEHGSFNGYETRILEKESFFTTPEILTEYMKPIKGMDAQVQQQIRSILKVFIQTRTFLTSLSRFVFVFFIKVCI